MPKRGPRGNYNTKKVEQRGKEENEPALFNSFWKQHTMDEVLAMTDEELDYAISRFVDNFVEAAKKRNSAWDFPDRLVTKIPRKKIKNEKYKADPFNKSFKGVDNRNSFIV